MNSTKIIRLKPAVACALLAVLIGGCSKSEAEEDVNTEEPAVENTFSIYEEGISAVRFSPEMAELVEEAAAGGKVITKSMALNELADEMGITSFRRVFGADPRYEKRLRAEGMDRWYYVEYSKSGPATKSADSFSAIDGVEISEPVVKIKVNDTFNDPQLSDMWGLGQSSGIDINVSDVWRDYTTGDQKVIVAVIDAGVDLAHEDLASNCLAGESGGSKNMVTGGYKIDAMDHGTHVAGTIAAVNNNGIGVSGIAGGNAATGQKGVSIMSLQIFSSTSTGGTGIPDAFRYAADNGAVIAQNSWGLDYDSNGNGVIDTDEYAAAKSATISSTYKAAIDYFIKYAGCDADGNQKQDSPMKGGVVLFSAGNDNIDAGLPASYEPVIAVSAIDKSGAKASYSNYGDWVDITAPGTSIMSTLPGNNYGTMSGTSMSCPHVSGVAALVVSYRGGYGFTNENLKDCLLNSANKSKVSYKTIGPLVDALGAVTYGVETAPEKIVTASAAVYKANSIEVKWTVPKKSDSEMPAYGAVIFAGTDREAVENISPSSPGKDVVSLQVSTSDKNPGDEASAVVTGLEFSTAYYVKLFPYNYGPVFGEGSSVMTVTTGENSAPVISASEDVSDIVLRATGSIIMFVAVEEPDGHDFTVNFESASDADNWVSLQDRWQLKINAPDAPAGTYTARIIATDSYGKTAELPVKYTIMENAAPEALKEFEPVYIVGKGKTVEISMDGYFSDPDGDTITYDVESPAGSPVHAVVNEGVLYMTSTGTGTATITVIAKDAKGASASLPVKVLVRKEGVVATVYPNPVKTDLYISTGADVAPADVKVVSSTGRVFFDESIDCSAFEPYAIDMSNAASGTYSVTITSEGTELKYNIVKI